MPEQMDQAFWDERYSSRPTLWSGKPNLHLVSETAELVPGTHGTAMDVGCGEGADAIWLASRGWHVTAVDLSVVALARAAANAANAGEEIAGRIEWHHLDLAATAPEPAAYDLVSAQYMHLPPREREALLRGLAAAVRPGGTLLVVGHHPSDLDTTMQRPHDRGLFFTGEDVVALLPPEDWEIVVDAVPGRAAEDPDGNPVTIHDTVLRARRRD